MSNIEATIFKRIRKCFIKFFDFMGREEGIKQYEDFREAAFLIGDTNDRFVFLQHRLLSMTSCPSKHGGIGDPKIIRRCYAKIISAKRRLPMSKAAPGVV